MVKQVYSYYKYQVPISLLKSFHIVYFRYAFFQWGWNLCVHVHTPTMKLIIPPYTDIFVPIGVVVDALTVSFLLNDLALVSATINIILLPNTLTETTLLIEDPLLLESRHDIVLLLQHPGSQLLQFIRHLYLYILNHFYSVKCNSKVSLLFWRWRRSTWLNHLGQISVLQSPHSLILCSSKICLQLSNIIYHPTVMTHMGC